MNRFDNRTKEKFKKDIKFGTMLEKYFFEKWMSVARSQNIIYVTSYQNNGCDNNGEFISHGNTSGADYKINGQLLQEGNKVVATIDSEPLEVKWVPSYGKLTLKEADLDAYVDERASILFIYNCGGVNLKKPKDYNLAKHIKLIEQNEDKIKWGIMWSFNVVRLFEHAYNNNLFKPIPYMGNKSGIVIQQKDFGKWFTSYNWRKNENS